MEPLRCFVGRSARYLPKVEFSTAVSSSAKLLFSFSLGLETEDPGGWLGRFSAGFPHFGFVFSRGRSQNGPSLVITIPPIVDSRFEGLSGQKSAVRASIRIIAVLVTRRRPWPARHLGLHSFSPNSEPRPTSRTPCRALPRRSSHVKWINQGRGPIHHVHPRAIPSRAARIAATKQVAVLLCRSWSRVKQLAPLPDLVWPRIGLTLCLSMIDNTRGRESGSRFVSTSDRTARSRCSCRWRVMKLELRSDVGPP